MLSRLMQVWNELRGSYWFIPSVMALSAVLCALFLTQNRWVLELSFFNDSHWLYKSTPEAAREVLSVIAGSMITVASVTFSITIAAVAYATSQFGPRLLTNFMSDRGNQWTLGTFISTFLYCLMVLRTLTGSDSDSGSVDFVPQVAVAGSVLFGVASIGVLIYFIHHVPASIHASNVIAEVGQQLLDSLDALYSRAEQGLELPSGEPVSEVHFDLRNSQALHASFDGFVQFVDHPTLMTLADELDSAIVLDVRPGDYVSKRSCLGWVLCTTSLEPEVEARFEGAFLYGLKRTAAQDVMFLAQELIEIAARALSPGVNDPFTAMNCLDWLGSSLGVVATKKSVDGHHYDSEGRLRLIAKYISRELFINNNLSRVRVYAATDRNAALHFCAVLGRVLLLPVDEDIRGMLLRQASELIECAKESLCDLDVEELKARYGILASIAADSRENYSMVHEHDWLGGSG
ncbi:putative protein [Halioglobus japonicus]|nr:putative protein [Halioglobus japonicus]